MSRVVRACLVWILVLALPVQGWAASAMLSCGPGHGRMGPAGMVEVFASWADLAGDVGDGRVVAGHWAQHDAAPHDAATPPRGAGAAADLGTDAGTDTAAVTSTDTATDTETGDADSLVAPHGPGGCSACAACCSALALPSSFSLPSAAGPVQAFRAAPSVPVASHQPDALDRPPRALLA